MELRTIQSGAPWEATYGYSRARRVGNHVYIAGTGPVVPAGVAGIEGVYAQANRCIEIISDALEAAGSSLRDVVETTFFLVDEGDFDEVGRAHGEAFGSIRPVTTGVVVAGLRITDWRVEMNAHAIVAAGGIE